MSQSDGEPVWQGKAYNASKDKKHLTGINKEESVRIGVIEFLKTLTIQNDYLVFTMT
jgi:hypothetical protein